MTPNAITDSWARTASRTARVLLPWLPQRLRAIDELHALGYAVEAYALARETLQQAASALKDSDGELASSIRALLQTPDLDPPLDAKSFDARHAAWLDVARALCERLRRAHAPRRPLPLLKLVCALLFVAATALLWLFATRLTASASASYHASFPPSHAVDGIEATEWLLPDGTTGHLDVALPYRKKVHAVTIVNAHNRAYLDRGIKRARLAVYDDDRVVDTLAIDFDKVEPVHTKRRFPLKGEPGTRVRITVLEGFGLSGGISEVAVE
jgi:hypothetical protein